MLINGRDLSARKLAESENRFSVFNSRFQELKLKTADNIVHELSKVEQPIVVLNFWASWCGPCLTEFEILKKAVDKFPKKMLLLGINNDTENALQQIKTLEKEKNLNFSSVVDEENKYASLFNIEALPATIAFYKGKAFYFNNKVLDSSEAFISTLEEKLNQDG